MSGVFPFSQRGIFPFRFNEMIAFHVGTKPMDVSIKSSPTLSLDETPILEFEANPDSVTHEILTNEPEQTDPSEETESSMDNVLPEPLPMTTTDILSNSSNSTIDLTTDSINASTPIIDPMTESKLASTTTSLPTRYGIAATIPYDNDFDLKSVLNAKSSIPFANHSNNELQAFLQKEKSKKAIVNDLPLDEILKENNRERNNLVQVARKAQQEFLDAIQLY